jgi:hypothetical protein
MKLFSHLRTELRPSRRKVASIVMRTPRVLGLSLFSIVTLSACADSMPGSRHTRLNASEKMMWSTYPVGSEKGMGTGFVVLRHDSSDRGGMVPVVVTAGHLLDAVGHKPFFIGTRMPDAAGGAEVALIEFKPPRGSGRFFVRHPKRDIGAFEMRLPEEIAGHVIMPSCLNDAMRSDRHLRAGEEVSFVGYPDVLPEMEGAFPILRTGRVASYPVGTARAEGLFVVNADVYPGDSGAPVFVTHRGGRPELAGMIIRRVGSDQKAFSHLAIAVDAKAIYEAVNMTGADNSSTAKDSRTKDRTR